ncbi:MAG TPA: lysylphosphatidylglycerol synthase transmembrane domain-containing protein [Chthoniobacteraceae bacterium]|nr:lysylphosphatidylglycerol synthase transmembrane domain-containing protein [Chthoniobacteraceae bacterium]
MKKLISLLISLVLLGVLYWKIDAARLLPVFARCDWLWMTLSLAMVVPLTQATAWRLQQLMPRAGQLGFGEANRLILVASVLNLVLPSKMGDIAKAWFMRDRGHLDGSLALSLVVFEKMCDMLSLLLWCVFGLVWLKFAGPTAFHSSASPKSFEPYQYFPRDWIELALFLVGGSLALGLLLIGSRSFAQSFFGRAARFAPEKVRTKIEQLGASWSEMHRYFWASPTRLTKVAFTSVFIWFLHLLQIWMFILALRAWAPFLANLALSPLAILAGLLPLTFAGVGTRDTALVLFYAPWFAAPTAAALGLLCTARYILPALGGLPFAGSYLQMTKGNAGAASIARP